MAVSLVDGVMVTPLKIIPLEKGDVFHGIKASDCGYFGFGEAYFSTVKHDEIKGWKKHTEMVLNLMVPEGEVQFVVYDDREHSSTFDQFYSVTLGKENYCRLTIPKGVWVAFKGIGQATNLLMNFASIEHDPEESVSRPLEFIKFNWSSQDA